MSEMGPPKSLEEFNKRLKSVVGDLFEETYGLSYHVGFSEKRLLNEVSNRNMIEIWKKLESFNIKECNRKLSDGNGHYSKCFRENPKSFLKEALEENFPFLKVTQKHLGIYIDRSGITLPEKNKITVQIAAQIIMSEEEKPVSWTLAELRRQIKANEELVDLLWLSRFSKERTIDEWIKPIFPIEIHIKRGSKNKAFSFVFCEDSLISIPGIISKNSNCINYQKLNVAITILSKILSIFGKTQEEILRHPVFSFYKKHVPLYFDYVCDEWAKEALLKDFSKAVFWV